MAIVLVVSPHPDDAVLSYGGQLAQYCDRGDRVIVYTVFAGSPGRPYSPAAARYHGLWGQPDEPVALRLEEDRQAIRLLGAVPIYGTFLDGIYRRDENGGWLVPPGGRSRGDHLSPEPALIAEIAAAVERLIGDNDPGMVITCSATGDHVDHARARNAVATAAWRTATPMRFWEDIPYGIRTDYVPPLPAGIELAESEIKYVDEWAWHAKMRAVECYASQHQTLVYRGISITEQLNAHGLALGSDAHRGTSLGGPHYGERVWHTTFGPRR